LDETGQRAATPPVLHGEAPKDFEWAPEGSKIRDFALFNAKPVKRLNRLSQKEEAECGRAGEPSFSLSESKLHAIS
jgi:hypothetical protein